MVWNIVLLLLFLAVGWGVYAMGICQIILYFRCTRPYTELLSLIYQGQTNSILRAGKLTCVIWVGIIIAVLVGLYFIGSTFAWAGFCLGFFFTALISAGKIQPNEVNFEDYINTYGKCYDPKLIEDYRANSDILVAIANYKHKQ